MGKSLKVISVHSYKGGVGKSTVCTLLGLALSKEKRVCLVDLDLLAPGLNFLLGVDRVEPAISDYLVVDPKKLERAATEEEICRTVDVRLSNGETRTLHLIGGRPCLEHARQLQPYILADVRAGLIRARITHMLNRVRDAREIDIFVLDTPPSIFGMSAAVLKLVEEQKGASIHVVTPIRQDVVGTYEMLTELQKSLKDEQSATQAILLNRSPSDLNGKRSLEVVAKTFMDELTRKFSARTAREQAKIFLSSYLAGYVIDSTVYDQLSRVGSSGFQGCDIDEVLEPPLMNLARDIMKKLGSE